MRVRDATFVVTDTETTGTAARRDRIIEIGAVKVEGGEVVDRFQQLVNPERSVPARITQITGITTAMVFDQPTAAEVLPRYLAFLGDGVLTAHNLPFDERFLAAELKRLGRPALAGSSLCTLRLARRLLPGLRSKGLSSLVQFYKINVEGRHRALGDAEATAVALQKFLSQLEFEHGLDTLEDVLAFQRKRYREIRAAPKHLRALRAEVLPALPERPGVYFMKGKSGATIYIGKAKRLKQRVKSYFNAVEAHGARRRKLVAATRDVEWQETDSELAALMLESRLIKKHKPRFNRAQRRYRSRPFIRLDTSEEYPRLAWCRHIEDDGAEYYGPLGGRREAELVMDVLARFFQLRECGDDQFAKGQRCLYASMDRCTAPCEGGAGAAAYEDEVQRVRDFLTGENEEVLAALEAEMHKASARLDFEQAAEYRDWREKLRRMLAKHRFVASPVLKHHAVLVVPGVDEGTVQLFCIRFGRHVETLAVHRPPTNEEKAHLLARLAHHFDPARERPRAYSKREVDEIRLLAHWMYRRRAEAAHVSWTPGQEAAAFMKRILAHAEAPAEAA